nr:MAG TPA: hypothetical protein [Caudoviricetes sp.]
MLITIGDSVIPVRAEVKLFHSLKRSTFIHSKRIEQT